MGSSVIESVATDVARKVEPDAPGFDILLITAIADMVFRIIERCREKNDDDDVVNRVSSPTARQRLRLRIMARRELPRDYRGKATEAANALVEAARDVSTVRAAVEEVAGAEDYFLA